MTPKNWNIITKIMINDSTVTNKQFRQFIKLFPLVLNI